MRDIIKKKKEEEKTEDMTSLEYQIRIYEEHMETVRSGNIVEGYVVRVDQTEVLIEIGFKAEGVMPISEFGEDVEIKVGDKISVFIANREGRNGRPLLSKKRADIQKMYSLEDVLIVYEKVQEYFNENFFWHNLDGPDKEEAEIFCQFIIMQMFIVLQYSKEVAYDFWEHLNSEYVSEYGLEAHLEFYEKKVKRFREYIIIGDELFNTPFMRKGGLPTTAEESQVITNFCKKIFTHVEKKYIPNQERDSWLCKECMRPMLLIMSGPFIEHH